MLDIIANQRAYIQKKDKKQVYGSMVEMSSADYDIC